MIVLRIALCTLLLATLALHAYSKEYDHPLIEQIYRLLPDGDAEVEEIRTFRFVGSFTWANLKRSTEGQYGKYDIEYLGVWDADSRAPLPYTQSAEGEYAVLRWEYRAQDTTRRFRLRYRIRNAVQRYNDVAQFYWKAIEDEHAPIAEVRIVLIPPAPSPELFKVFIHSKAAPGRLKFEDDFSRATIEQRDIPSDSFVEVRALLSPSIFANAPRIDGNRYETFLEEERRFAEAELKAARRREQLHRLLKWAVGLEMFIVPIILIGMIGSYISVYRRYGTEPPVPDDVEYEREPPRELPPAVVPAILTQHQAQSTEVVKGFAATLLEAARLGYLTIEEEQKSQFLGLLTHTERRYALTEAGKALLERKPMERTKDKRSLQPFEVAVLRVAFQEAGNSNSFTETELRTWAKDSVGTKTNMLRFVESWGKQMRRWFEREYFRLDDPHSERAKKRYLTVTTVVMVGGAILLFPVGTFVLIPAGIVLAAVAYHSLSRRSPEAAREFQRWNAFRRFMTDFSAMKEAGPELLPLWERYLVYATALGVADKMLRNLALVAQEYNRTIDAPAWYHGAFGSNFSASSVEGMSDFVQNLQGLTSALSTSTSSGGGFSSGGGGGGGGGSSGAG